MSGKYFENFTEGERYLTRSRVVTETDVDLFAGLTGATNPLFLCDGYAKSLGFKSRLTPGLLTVSLMVGLMYQLGLFDNILALVSIDKLRFTASVVPGDSIRAETTVVSKKEISKMDRGIVTLKTICKNQNEDIVLDAEFVIMMRRKQP